MFSDLFLLSFVADHQYQCLETIGRERVQDSDNQKFYEVQKYIELNFHHPPPDTVTS